jgi:hypothetical protein
MGSFAEIDFILSASNLIIFSFRSLAVVSELCL